MFHSNCGSISCRFWDIQRRKNTVTLKSRSKVNQGHTFDRLGMVSYWCSIVTLSISFWDIRLQQCRDLENRVRGPSRSLKMSPPYDRAHEFLLTFYSNYMYASTSSHFWDTQCRKCRIFEIRARGYSMSFKVVPFDRLRMVSY